MGKKSHSALARPRKSVNKIAQSFVSPEKRDDLRCTQKIRTPGSPERRPRVGYAHEPKFLKEEKIVA